MTSGPSRHPHAGQAVLCLLLALLAPSTAAGSAFVPELSWEDNYRVLVDGWLFQVGDDSSWADPATEDATWDTVSLVGFDWEDSWEGTAWFRLHLQLDSANVDNRLALEHMAYGAVEIYFDGELIDRRGRFPDHPEGYRGWVDMLPFHLDLPDGAVGDHVIAVRLNRGPAPRRMNLVGYPDVSGFWAGIGVMEVLDRWYLGILREQRLPFFFTGLLATAGVVGLLLALRVRAFRLGLYFGLFALMESLGLLIFFLTDEAMPIAWIVPWFTGFELVAMAVYVFILLFLYEAFDIRRRNLLLPLIGFAVLVTLVSVLLRRDLTYFYYVPFVAEIVRTLVAGTMKGGKRALFFTIPFSLLILGFIYETLIYWEVIPDVVSYMTSWALTRLIPAAAMLVLFAERFSRVHRRLESQLRRVRDLTAQSLIKEGELREKEREALEVRASVERQRRESVRQLATAVAHEFNTPLTVLQGIADIMSWKEIPTKEKERQIAKLPGLVARMRNLADKLTSLERIKSTEYAHGVLMLDIDSSTERDDSDDPGADPE